MPQHNVTIYSLSSSALLFISNGSQVEKEVQKTLRFAQYFLKHEIALNLTDAIQLSSDSSEFFFDLQAKQVLLLPGDMPAVFQPDSLGYVLQTTAGNSLIIDPENAIGWNSRVLGSELTADNSVLLTNQSVSSADQTPLIVLSFARPFNLSVQLKFTDQSCLFNYSNCHNTDYHDVKITVTNNVSSVSVAKHIAVQIPLSNVRVDLHPYWTFSIASVFPNYFIGSSDAIWSFDFGDYHNNKSYLDAMNLVLQVMPASHCYAYAGTYTGTLSASNGVSQVNFTEQLLVQDSLQNYQLYPVQFPVAPIGQDINFVLIVPQGSNASFTVDFGDDSDLSTINADVTLNDINFNGSSITRKTYLIKRFL